MEIKKCNKSRMPIVGVPTDRHEIGGLPYDCTQHKYLAALYRSAKVLPMPIPLFGKDIDIDAILENVDGVMLTGSHSNIHPRNYRESGQEPEFKLDVERDATILPLIKPTIEQGIPLFAICRGFQELNVAFGGTLHTRLNLVGSFNGHSEDTSLPIEQRYNAAHEVKLVSGGELNRLLDMDSIKVNSLHDQGIDKLGDNLIVEGHTEDGLIEAVSVEGSKNFAIGVQWHPEWQSTKDPVSTVIFTEFGKACYSYAGYDT
jgi:putative glutamine amidotransferase